MQVLGGCPLAVVVEVVVVEQYGEVDSASSKLCARPTPVSDKGGDLVSPRVFLFLLFFHPSSASSPLFGELFGRTSQHSA